MEAVGQRKFRVAAYFPKAEKQGVLPGGAGNGKGQDLEPRGVGCRPGLFLLLSGAAPSSLAQLRAKHGSQA